MQNENEILTMNKKLASKKEIKFTLSECLSDLTKERLNKIASTYEIPKRSKMKKEELIEAICKVINDFQVVKEKISFVDEENLIIIRELLNKEYIVSTENSLFSYVPLLNYGILFTYLKDDEVLMAMPNEVKEALKDFNCSNNDERVNEVSKYIMAFAEVYGVFEADILIDTFNSQNENSLSNEEFNTILDKVEKSKKIVKRYNNYIVEAALLYNTEALDKLLKDREGKEYYKLNSEKVQAYSKGFYCEMTEAHKALYDVLFNLCKKTEITDKLFEDICGPLVFTKVNVQYIISELRKRNIVLNTMNEFQNILSKIEKVNANTRKWANKGYTEAELVLLPSKKLLGRNEPCLCGSGKKYKKCCGK